MKHKGAQASEMRLRCRLTTQRQSTTVDSVDAASTAERAVREPDQVFLVLRLFSLYATPPPFSRRDLTLLSD